MRTSGGKKNFQKIILIKNTNVHYDVMMMKIRLRITIIEKENTHYNETNNNNDCKTN